MAKAQSLRIRGRRLQRIRDDHFRRFPLCQRCEERGLFRAAVELDHILPLGRGGQDVPSNRRGLCRPCHLEVTAEQFGHERKRRIGLDGYPIE